MRALEEKKKDDRHRWVEICIRSRHPYLLRRTMTVRDRGAPISSTFDFWVCERARAQSNDTISPPIPTCFRVLVFFSFQRSFVSGGNVGQVFRVSRIPDRDTKYNNRVFLFCTILWLWRYFWLLSLHGRQNANDGGKSR